jgi:hypothetical protein
MCRFRFWGQNKNKNNKTKYLTFSPPSEIMKFQELWLTNQVLLKLLVFRGSWANALTHLSNVLVANTNLLVSHYFICPRIQQTLPFVLQTVLTDAQILCTSQILLI